MCLLLDAIRIDIIASFQNEIVSENQVHWPVRVEKEGVDRYSMEGGNYSEGGQGVDESCLGRWFG